jgi:hypothetical protein
MIPIDTHVKPANEFLAAFLGAVCGFGEEDETGAGSPGWFAGLPIPIVLVYPSVSLLGI